MPKRSEDSPPGPGTTRDRPTAGPLDPILEKARTRSNAARRQHDGAQVEVERRQLALVANEARVRSREQAIEQARRLLAENREALKQLRRERPKLERKLRAAKDAEAKAGRTARKRESRYDDAMLRHVVEREKSVDRALNTV